MRCTMLVATCNWRTSLRNRWFDATFLISARASNFWATPNASKLSGNTGCWRSPPRSLTHLRFLVSMSTKSGITVSNNGRMAAPCQSITAATELEPALLTNILAACKSGWERVGIQCSGGGRTAGTRESHFWTKLCVEQHCSERQADFGRMNDWIHSISHHFAVYGSLDIRVNVHP